LLILQHGRALIDAFFGAVLHGAIPSIMPFLTEKLLPERYAGRSGCTGWPSPAGRRGYLSGFRDRGARRPAPG